MHMDWKPDNYLGGGKAELRTRPARALLARVPLENPALVYDLGCGPGNSTILLKQRWPEARVVGVDNSAAMLEKARAEYPDLTFEEGDIGDWRPSGAPDLIFANASIHWVPDHYELLLRLFDALAPGGCLAIQQPNNFDAPSHALISEIAGEPQFRPELKGRLLGIHVQDATDYHTMLRGVAEEVDVWETEYVQPLEGEDPVLDWVRTTTLLPIQQTLSVEGFALFERIYAARLREAYPAAEDGVTLFPFRRMFIYARKAV